MPTENKKTVFVGLSGGVDSSVAALLLKKQNFNVIGAFIKSYNVDGCEEEDAEYARRAAEKLYIPFYVFDMREEYFKKVVAEMIDGYRAGITPNPDVLCNREIKFGLFWERAKALGADYIATGHYARISCITEHVTKSNNNVTCYKLYAAVDTNKDQTYFLWKLTQDDLSHVLFPIGDYTKPEVRKIARQAGLPAAERKDSQGICFLGKVKLPNFLKKYIAEKKGDIVDTEGRKLGEHDGAWFYTIGQRHINASLKAVSLKLKADRKPYYVVSKDVETNTLVVAEGEDNPALYRKEVGIADVNFINPEFQIPNSGLQILCRVRYRQPLQKARIMYHEARNKTESPMLHATSYMLRFEEAVKFVAPGQSAVWYSEKGELLGGGVIV